MTTQHLEIAMSPRYRRSCRTCGWSRSCTTAKLADRAKRQHSCATQIAKAQARVRGAERMAAIDRTPKPCLHKHANHQHGTNAAYVLDKCRCQPCSAARARQDSNRARLQAYGRYDRYVDARESRDHLLWLKDQGMGPKRVAAASGIGHGVISAILYGKYAGAGIERRPPNRRVLRTTHDRIMAIGVDLALGARVPAVGTHRRIQALVALGWSQSKIAVRLGMSPSNFGLLIRRGSVQRRTRDAMVAVYDALSMQLPPQDEWRDKIAASRARNYATIHGWAPPLAWDDDTIDDPAAAAWRRHDDSVRFRDADLDEAAILRRLGGDKTVRLNVAEKEELFRRSRAAGVSYAETARRTGLTKPERYTPKAGAA